MTRCTSLQERNERVETSYAQTAEFYVVHEPSTKKCTIVTSKPTTTTTTIVDGRSFKTRGSRERDEDHEGLHHELEPSANQQPTARCFAPGRLSFRREPSRP
jgi:hypothetical protein